MEILDQINLEKGVISILNDNILRFEVKKTDEITVADLRQFNLAIGEIGAGKQFLNLIVIKDFVLFDKEIRNYAASAEANKYTIADAIVVNSSALKMVGNFYIKFNKPLKPSRIFTSEKEAIQWLKTFTTLPNDGKPNFQDN